MRAIVFVLGVLLSIKTLAVTDDVVMLAVHAIISQDQFRGESLNTFRKLYKRAGLGMDNVVLARSQCPDRVNVFYNGRMVANLRVPDKVTSMDFNQRFASGKKVKFRHLKYHRHRFRKSKIPQTEKDRATRDKQLSARFNKLTKEYFRRLFTRTGLPYKKLLFLFKVNYIVVFYDDIRIGMLYYPHKFI